MEYDDVVDEMLDDCVSFDHLTNEELFQMLDEESYAWFIMALDYNSACERYFATFVDKHRRNPPVRRGLLYMQDAIGRSSGKGERARCDFRMSRELFVNLVCYLKSNFGLDNGRGVDMYEKVGMFLYVLAHGMGLRQVQAQFDHSLSTISACFTEVLKAVMGMAAIIIKPHPDYNNGVEHHHPSRPAHSVFKVRLRPLKAFFSKSVQITQACMQNCIGAIDGTHVSASVKTSECMEWMCCKGFPSQNVLAVCDFNLCFTFVMASHCGRVHDARLLAKAILDPQYQFPHPGPGKYYLVDSGFANKTGYLAPYKGTDIRYHFQEFNRAPNEQARRFRNRQERFNFTHSSCRNIVERSFGVLKQRWKSLDRMGRFRLDKQVAIVISTMALHNYLRRAGYVDEYFEKYDDPDVDVDPDLPDTEDEAMAESSTPAAEGDEWTHYRDYLAHKLETRSRRQ